MQSNQENEMCLRGIRDWDVTFTKKVLALVLFRRWTKNLGINQIKSNFYYGNKAAAIATFKSVDNYLFQSVHNPANNVKPNISDIK